MVKISWRDGGPSRPTTKLLSPPRICERRLASCDRRRADVHFRHVGARLQVDFTRVRTAFVKSSTLFDFVINPSTPFFTSSFGPPRSETITGKPGGLRFDDDISKSVGGARKNENVGGSVDFAAPRPSDNRGTLLPVMLSASAGEYGPSPTNKD